MLISLLLLIFAVFLFVTKNDKLILLYIVLLSTNEIFAVSSDIIGQIGTKDVINILTLIYLIVYKKRIKKPNEIQKYSTYLIYLLIVFFCYIDIKALFFNIYDLSFFSVFINIFQYFFRFFPLSIILISKNINIKKTIVPGIIIGVIIISISSIFHNYLDIFGFTLYSMYDRSGNLLRSYGFYSGGDQNSLGAFLNIFLAFYFIYCFKFIKSFNIINLIIIALTLSAIFVTGSRMAFITLVLNVVLLLLYSVKKRKLNKYLIIILLIFSSSLIIFLSLPQTEFFLDRFSGIENEILVDVSNSRTVRWGLYLKAIIQTPLILLRGCDKLIFVWGKDSYAVDPHNFFIHVLFFGGILFLSLSIKFIYKIFNAIYEKEKISLLLIIPTLISFTFISAYGIIWYLLLFLGIMHSLKINEISKKDII